MHRADPFDGRFQRIKAFIGEESRDIRSHPAPRVRFIDDNDTPDILRDLQQRIFIEGRCRAWINHAS